MQNPKIILGLPAYEEELVIGSMILQAKQYVNEVVVIDDGSSDETAKIAELAEATVLKHNINQGKGAAIKTVVNYAKEHDVDILVLMDSDGQHSPAEIQKLLTPIINDEADIVNGSRFLSAIKNQIPAHRKVGQEILNAATKFADYNVNVTDSQNGFRAFSKKTFDMFKFKNTGFGIESEMLIDAVKEGAVIVEVPISVRYDVPHPHSKNSFQHGFSVLNSIIQKIEQKHPLAYFGIPGLFIFVLGIFLGFHTLYGYKVLGDFWIGKAMLTMVFMLFGSFSLFTGIILNSIATLLAVNSK